MSCTICHQSILTATQRYLIDSGKGKLNVRELLSNLPFSVNICSAYKRWKRGKFWKIKRLNFSREIRTLTGLCRQDTDKGFRLFQVDLWVRVMSTLLGRSYFVPTSQAHQSLCLQWGLLLWNPQLLYLIRHFILRRENDRYFHMDMRKSQCSLNSRQILVVCLNTMVLLV
jgi:hypothetical protein